MIKTPIYKPRVSKNQRKYVLDCLESNWISSRGKYVDRFEQQLQQRLRTKHVITTSNGSTSLMLILKALGVGHGDEVITQSLTYAATVSSIINVGATAVLVDSTENFQLDIKAAEKAMTKRTAAIMVASLYGDTADLYELQKLCKKRGIYLIEDSAECFDGLFDNKPIGTFGIAGSFSFFGNKIITTGEGGCVATECEELATKMRLLKAQNHIGSYKHSGPGYNFRMTNIQAAIGCAQLEELDNTVQRKQQIQQLYEKHLQGYVTPVPKHTKVVSSEWMPLWVLPSTIAFAKFSERCLLKGIDVRPCFTPVHLMRWKDTTLRLTKCKVAERIYTSAFNLPAYPDLTDQDIESIAAVVKKAIKDIN